MHFTSTLAVVAIVSIGAFAADQCYYPDGTFSTDVPCNSTATHSACCGSDSYCLSNGACMSSGILSRGSCTDKSWDADECCPYCQNYNTGGGYALVACTNSTFTCGFNLDACSTESSVFLMHDADPIVLKLDQLQSAMEAAGVSTGTSTSDSASETSATSVSVVTVTASATGSAAPDNGKQYTAGQMAGVGAGVGVPLLLAVGALSWLLVREKKRVNGQQPAFHPLSSPEPTANTNSWAAWNQPVYNPHQRVPTELSSEQVMEIDTPHRLAELEPKHR